MCGRYTLTAADPAQLRARFAFDEPVSLRPRFNVAPGDEILALTADADGARRPEFLRWGLVPPFMAAPPASGTMINARAESIRDKPAFRGAFKRQRCLIPADGFYEWARLPDEPSPDAPGAGTRIGPNARRAPVHITRVDGQAFAFAGLSSVWHRGAPEEIRSATILTTAPNALVAPLHDRMPVILEPDAEALWLDPGTPAEVLEGLMAGLVAEAMSLRRVSFRVNDARHDAPDCLDAPEFGATPGDGAAPPLRDVAGPAAEPAQGQLF